MYYDPKNLGTCQAVRNCDRVATETVIMVMHIPVCEVHANALRARRDAVLQPRYAVRSI